MTIRDKIQWRIKQFIKRYYPFLWSRYLYRCMFGKYVDFKHPKDVNEKIQWLMFYTDIKDWSLYADKYAVREYVKSRIGEEYLVPLLGHWMDAADIDFESLPSKFVMKPNNGSYDSYICLDKSQMDVDDIRRRMSYSLRHKFGYENAEPHYLMIKPCIIAEQLLELPDGQSLNDYKIWCFNGVPYSIFVCLDRDSETHHCDFLYYDLDWNLYSNRITEKYRSNKECPKPDNLEEMLEIARKLSENIPQVRIDLYNINGNIYFGEMTMSSNFGMMPYFTQEELDRMGDLCSLPQRSLYERFVTFFKRWSPYL